MPPKKAIKFKVTKPASNKMDAKADAQPKKTIKFTRKPKKEEKKAEPPKKVKFTRKPKEPTTKAPTPKAPKWTEKLPDKVFLIKDTKRNAISVGQIDFDKLFEIDRKKTNVWGALESGTISDIEKGIKENRENKMTNYDKKDKLSVKEKSLAMEKLIKDIREGRFKFEERKIEKTKTGIKIDGKKYGKTAWENISSFRGGRPLLSRYFVKKIDLTK